MGPLEQLLAEWQPLPAGRGLLRADHLLAGVHLSLTTDAPELLAELADTLGPAVPPPPAGDGLQASVRAAAAPSGHGLLQLTAPGGGAFTPEDFELAFEAPEFPFERLAAPEGWTAMARRGEPSPFFALQGGLGLVRLDPGWTKAVALLLFQRLMRAREDAIFFHAGSVGLFGTSGLLLVGPKGAGKSTLSLALAARGHALLGDENAAYRPAAQEIIPCRRPVGIKPGPRAEAVDAALRRLGRVPERDGMMRIDPRALWAGPEPRPVPLRSVVFLEGFAAAPRLRRLAPGREELARLQPVASSLVNAPRARRVFEMVQMLAAARCYLLQSGPPDATARALEEIAEQP